jgi:WhiB family redox-sensing transcriptional regulator
MILLNEFRLLDSNQDWMRLAACKGLGSHLFFPERGANVRLHKAAKNVCGRCVVRGRCLQFALANNITDGVWGGLTGAEREKLLTNPDETLTVGL